MIHFLVFRCSSGTYTIMMIMRVVVMTMMVILVFITIVFILPITNHFLPVWYLQWSPLTITTCHADVDSCILTSDSPWCSDWGYLDIPDPVWFLYEVIGAERYPKKGMRIPEWCMSRSVVENVFQENYKRINVTWRFAVRNGPSILQ